MRTFIYFLTIQFLIIIGCSGTNTEAKQSINDIHVAINDTIIDSLMDNSNTTNMKKYNTLTEEEKRVIINKGTEAAYTGEYYKNKSNGLYICKQCDAPLYNSSDKFESNCGWPSFDDEIEGAVIRKVDTDGRRTEILCANCDAHLGHVFLNEGFTDKNTRHCVNSISLKFISQEDLVKMDTAIFASGCFWGTEYYLQKAEGVISTKVGYIGGRVENPSYQQVCTDTTGHAEAVLVLFDPTKTDYTKLAKLFFETHDFTQYNRQGPDVGSQYRSAIFYVNDEQKKIAEDLKLELYKKGYDIETEITKSSQFWEAENYHQNYYEAKNGTPYCHIYKKIFD